MCSKHQDDQTPGDAWNVRLGTMWLVLAAIFDGARLFCGRIIPVYPIDDFLQGQVWHNELQITT